MTPHADDAPVWAAFSTFDHLAHGAYLADLVLYDRLIVPVPPADEPSEWKRWSEQGWDPERQRELLTVIDPVVERVEWNEMRRYGWQQQFVETRSTTAKYLQKSLAGELTAMGLFDVAPAMARPVVATSPYTSLDQLTAELGIQRAAGRTPLPGSAVSAVVGREILLPADDSRSELDLLREAVHVVTGEADYRNARAALQRRLARFQRDGATDLESLRAAVAEIKQASDELERAVRKRKIWVSARRVFSFAQIGLGAALTPLSPIAIGLVVAGIGQFTASEVLADSDQPLSRAPDLAMLLDIRRELEL